MKSTQKTSKIFYSLQRKCHSTIGFSLVELLVVVAILAILGVVAYQAFGGQTSKARDSRRIQDLATIEGAIQVFNQEKGYFPMPAAYDPAKPTENVWGYKAGTPALAENTIATIEKNGEEITNVSGFAGGGDINDSNSNPIGAKGVIDSSVLKASRLSKVPSDPGVSNIPVGTKKMIDWGIGNYIYSVAAANSSNWGAATNPGKYYQLAATLENDGIQMTYILGNYDTSVGTEAGVTYPESLIGSDSSTLIDKQSPEIPYPITF